MRFSQSTYLLMFLSLETTSIMRNGFRVLVELIDLVNSVTILQPSTLQLCYNFKQPY